LGLSRRPWISPSGAYNLQVHDYNLLPPRDTYVHLAEESDIGTVERLGNTHYLAAVSLVEILLKKASGRVVYASSAAVYGNQAEFPHEVNEPVLASDTYTRTKLACEQRVLAAGGAVLRLSNLFGPGMAANNILGDILQQIPGAGAVRVRDLAPIRDFLWISDAAKAVCDIVAAKLSGVFNVGTGVGVSIGELAARCLFIAGEESREVLATAPGSESNCLVVNISGTTRACGWKPSTPLDVGLAKLLANRITSAR
jgi:UDP-glucose 4-epimerase